MSAHEGRYARGGGASGRLPRTMAADEGIGMMSPATIAVSAESVERGNSPRPPMSVTSAARDGEHALRTAHFFASVRL